MNSQEYDPCTECTNGHILKNGIWIECKPCWGTGSKGIPVTNEKGQKTGMVCYPRTKQRKPTYLKAVK